ncbi:MAG: DUF2309 domain-containing protein [Chitinophagaceae bacterium]
MENTYQTKFDLYHTLHDLKHYLPTQMTLKDFVHHNTLHAFQHEKFYDGIFRASKIFGYKVTLQLADYRQLFNLKRIREHVIERVIIDRKGPEALKTWAHHVLTKEYDENIKPRVGLFRSDWKRVYKIDLDTLVHPLLYRILGAYLDQGISLWNFPIGKKSFIETMRDMEKNSSSGFFKTKKVKELLLDSSIQIEHLLKLIVGDELYFEQYLYDMSFSHRGWSGMVAVLEEKPEALLIQKPISLQDFIHYELLMELDMLYVSLGNSWKPLAKTALEKPKDILAKTSITELDEVYAIWQDAFEWSYYDDVISGISQNLKKQNSDSFSQELENKKIASFQAIFCIDERECSIRRNLEYIAPDCETLGAPGFFGVEFYYKQHGAQFIDKLCPAPVTPKYLIKEYDVKEHKHADVLFSSYANRIESVMGATLGLGLLSLGKLFQTTFKPKMSPSISDAFSHMNPYGKLTVENKHIDDIEDGLQIGFTIDEMTIRIENFLRGIGLTKYFSEIVYMVAHGSSSANNPHHGAHDCGACSGRPGCVNARVFAIMANHSKVREKLKTLGIYIPDSTVFIGAMHDTASDLIRFYDDENLNTSQKQLHIETMKKFEDALDLNAKERSRRFASISTNQNIKKIRKAIEARSVSLFEPRPELGHGTNTLAIIGRREMTRGLFLDRRAFLNSYDYRTDLDGTFLANVMAPIGVVCGGINLEYYFSRVDNLKLGCGTKLPHNVVGLLSVANSSDGDIRPGLPWQMIEPHDPVRLLVVVEHYPEIVLKVIKTNEAMYEWYKNEWVHIVALDPDTKTFYYLQNEHFVHYNAEAMHFKEIDDVHELFEKAPEMITNHITHATFENLPIYQIENNIKCNTY